MPGTFVVGHGAYYVDGADTFVPNNMTVYLYADEGEGIPAPNVIEILRYRGGQQSVKTIQSGQPIKNLILQRLTQNQYETELGAVQPGERVCFVGYDAPAAGVADYTLCMGACDPAAGVHNCTGLFTLFNGVAELHLLACMEQRGQEMTDREHLPWENAGDAQHYDRIQELVSDLAGDIGFDPGTGAIADYDNADAAARFDALAYEDQVKLMTYEPIQQWSYIRYARQTKTKMVEQDFRRWINSQEQWVKDIYKKDATGIGTYLT